MIRMGEIEDGIAEDHLQFLVLTSEGAGEGIVTSLDDNALPGPLPELPLGCPKLAAIMANHSSVTLPLLWLSGFYGHLICPRFRAHYGPCLVPCRLERSKPELEKYPERETSCARQRSWFKSLK